MFWYFPPSHKPTRSEWAVLLWFVAAVLIGFGAVAFVLAYRAPAEKAEEALALMHAGLWRAGIGVALLVGYWLYRRVIDY
jgi:hypothetical protein